MLEDLKSNLKNIVGKRIDRKIVVFSVDDYGTIRTASKKAKENMKKEGLKMLSYFDEYDALETTDDMTALYEVLQSVKDKNGNPAVFTAFALSANIDFEKIIKSDYTKYEYELLPETYKKLGAEYNGVMSLWKKGMNQKLIKPQFHGREHLNIKLFNKLLNSKDKQLMINFENRSYSAINDSIYPTISFPAAFDFDNFSENEDFKSIIKDGLISFEKVFGFRATHFNAPGDSEHHILHKTLKENGIISIDQQLIGSEHQGNGKYKKVFSYMGRKTKADQTILIRNCVFEPQTRKGIDWVAYTLKQIDAAFRWKKPAIISSHRVNFAGHIDPNNRKEGLSKLRSLLKQIVKKWPDVEFMNVDELVKEISNK